MDAQKIQSIWPGAYSKGTGKDEISLIEYFQTLDPERNRYNMDFEMPAGFYQIDTDQDAPYFGAWCSHEQQQVLTFAEGDISLETFFEPAAYQAKIQKMGRVDDGLGL